MIDSSCVSESLIAGLSDTQKEAVLSQSAHLRIIAGAGAGKTETLTRKIVHLLLVEKVAPSAIVAFTFTEKAAKSMKSRVYERVKEFGGEELCFHLGDMFIGTIHGYCNRILETEFKCGNYTIFDDKQEMAFLLQHGWDLGLGKNGYYAGNCEKFLRSLNVVYGEMVGEHVLKEKARKFFGMMQKYEELLERNKCLTFNLLIDRTIRCLQERPDVAKNIEYLIVDEYQDINRAQELLINILGKDGHIFVVGDPRQTIYQWRGSDDRCFRDFAQTYPDTQTLVIPENRRSVPSVITAANNFADTIDGETYDHMIPTREGNGGVFVVSKSSDGEEVQWIVGEIERLVREGKCRYKDIALLFRSVKTSAPPFIETMRERRIPFVVGGKVGLFRRPEIRALGMLFCWLSPEGFWQEDRYHPDSKISGEGLLEAADEAWELGMGVKLPRDALYEWRDAVLSDRYKNFTEVYFSLLEDVGVTELNADDPVQAAVMANMGKFSVLLADFEHANTIGGKKGTWERDLKGLCWYMNTFASSQYEEQTGEEISSVDAVQIMTIHQSKGLEWPVVFIPAMVSKRFPSSMTGRQQQWCFDRSVVGEDVAKRYDGDESSERKLLYVAMTRAKEVVVFSHFTRLNGRRKGESCFLADLRQIDVCEAHDDMVCLPDCTFSCSDQGNELETFGVREVMDYGKCPMLYRFRHVWSFMPSITETMGYGSSLHFCLREAALLVKNEEYAVSTAVADAVEEHFFLPFMSQYRMEAVQKNAKKILLRFCQVCEDDMMRVKEVETHIEFPLQRAILSGQVDVILHGVECAEEIEVRDYKTKESVISSNDMETQVRLYGYGLSATGERVKAGSVAYIDDAAIHQVEMSEEAINRTVYVVGEQIKGIRTGAFAPCPGEACASCDYEKICPKQR